MLFRSVVTNPGPTAYARYVSVQAETYLSEEICAELPPGLGNLLADQCAELVETLQPQLDSLIRDRTNRLNLGVASLYQTSFGIPELPMLPEYKGESRTEERRGGKEGRTGREPEKEKKQLIS